MNKSFLDVDVEGNKTWRNINGGIHREEGPAYESIDGVKCYWINGAIHREDGPAYTGHPRNENQFRVNHKRFE